MIVDEKMNNNDDDDDDMSRSSLASNYIFANKPFRVQHNGQTLSASKSTTNKTSILKGYTQSNGYYYNIMCLILDVPTIFIHLTDIIIYIS